MANWKTKLKYDPTHLLAASDDIALRYSYENDIVGTTKIRLVDVWESKKPQSILKKQKRDGSWKYPSKSPSMWRELDYDQYQTVKQFCDLVERYRFTYKHPAIQKIAEYFFNYQTQEGDIRGIYGHQYTPNYTAVILDLLIKAGFAKDKRVQKSLDWLLRTKQEDGGWALAFRTQGLNLSAFDLEETIQPNFAKPSSAMVTGVVLRAMSAHPRYKKRPEVTKAAHLVADQMFLAEKYPDRKHKDYWTRFAFPFIYTNLLSALDSLSILGRYGEHAKVQEALNWIKSRQTRNGSFDLRIVRGNSADQKLWLNLVICRIYKRFFE